MGEGTASQRKARAAERRKRAFEMRQLGASYASIGEQLGITAQAAWKMIHKELENMSADTAAHREAVRTMELERLDRMFMGCYRGATTGNKDDILSALRIMERRAKLIGLDAPAKVSNTDPTGEQERAGGILVLPDTAPGVEEWLESVRKWQPSQNNSEEPQDPDKTQSD